MLCTALDCEELSGKKIRAGGLISHTSTLSLPTDDDGDGDDGDGGGDGDDDDDGDGDDGCHDGDGDASMVVIIKRLEQAVFSFHRWRLSLSPDIWSEATELKE